uniref:Peptidase M20 dimerisation domain-containing protein n=1 Tax=Globisporangium ultimum (strain ATCC 200006 / CBS 805.95 / DAOM BR144) TaxID=431595 RepID=K3X9Z4_GLOUD
MSEDSAKKMKQGAGKRLNDKQRVEIIQISENSKISKRQLADKYGVSEAAIRKLLLKKDDFLKRYYDTPEEIRDQRLRGKNLSMGDAADGTSAAGEAGEYTRAAGAGSHATGTAHAKSLYPSDDPWKQGLHALAGKVTPFLKHFVQAKPVRDATAVAAAIAAAGDVLVGDQTLPTAAVEDPIAAAAAQAAAVDWIGFSRMLRDIRRAFHRYPELGYQEVRTQSFIKRFCETTLRIPGKNIQTIAVTGLIVDVCFENATIPSSDKRKLPVLAFRADMDALPIEELNDHLPYVSTQKKQRKELRKRKKRKSMSGNAVATPVKPTDETQVALPDEAGLATLTSRSINGEDARDATADLEVETPSSPTPVGADGDDFESDVPGVFPAAAHMCGHDGHMVMVLGLCALVVRNAHLLPQDTFVRFIFQPAEEGPGGAKKMIEEGALEGVDEVYGLHNYPFPLYSVHMRPGPVMAHEVEFSIDIHGVGGHGSAPQQCVDPILAGSMVVQALQSIVSRSLSPTDTAVVSVTQFRGGDTNNVIPSHVFLGGTIRDFDLEVAEKIKARMEAIVHSTCAAHGATAQVHFSDGYAPVINPYEETRNVQQVAMDIGLYVSEQGLPLMAAEDFSYYLQERKGCFFFLGTKEDADDDKTRALHSNQYDFNDKAIPLGIRLFLGILQSRFQCELYSVEELQAFQVAMERIALPSSVTIV